MSDQDAQMASGDNSEPHADTETPAPQNGNGVESNTPAPEAQKAAEPAPAADPKVTAALLRNRPDPNIDTCPRPGFYKAPTSRLLQLGDNPQITPERIEAWKIRGDHVPDLVRMVFDPVLEFCDNELRSRARVNALKVLCYLAKDESLGIVHKLVPLFDKYELEDDDDMSEEDEVGEDLLKCALKRFIKMGVPVLDAFEPYFGGDASKRHVSVKMVSRSLVGKIVARLGHRSPDHTIWLRCLNMLTHCLAVKRPVCDGEIAIDDLEYVHEENVYILRSLLRLHGIGKQGEFIQPMFRASDETISLIEECYSRGWLHTTACEGFWNVQKMLLTGSIVPGTADAHRDHAAVSRRPALRCAFCTIELGTNSNDPAKPKAMRCSACKRVTYCSKQCHSKHWPVHKQDCSRPPQQPAPEA